MDFKVYSDLQRPLLCAFVRLQGHELTELFEFMFLDLETMVEENLEDTISQGVYDDHIQTY